MTLKAEAVEQRLLHHPPLAHHGVSPRFAVKIESPASHRGKDFFNEIGRFGTFTKPSANGRCLREAEDESM